MDFPAPIAIFKDFEGLKFVFIKFKDFHGASEPCINITSANVGKDSQKQNRCEWRQMVWVPEKWTRFAKQGSSTPSIEFSRSS